MLIIFLHNNQGAFFYELLKILSKYICPKIYYQSQIIIILPVYCFLEIDFVTIIFIQIS